MCRYKESATKKYRERDDMNTQWYDKVKLLFFNLQDNAVCVSKKEERNEKVTRV